ncbi:MAG TPA: hypothetical protein VFQ05_01000 [Candidatus Eisenbacteria bacterium]|nr:hypothetical protein [Candidatus Eisenbacteria bacterium]
MPGPNATIGRRRFVQLMGWAGAAAVAHGGPALAAAAQKSKVANRPVTSPASPPPSPAPGSEVSAEARALAEVVKQRYGANLSPQELEAITKDLEGDLKAIQRLRESKLANADEPDITFKA